MSALVTAAIAAAAFATGAAAAAAGLRARPAPPWAARPTATVVAIRTSHGVRATPAVRLGALAATPYCGAETVGNGRFTITHLPSGYSLSSGACVFRSLGDATAALIELTREIDWARVRAEDLGEIARMVRAIGERHRGERFGRGDARTTMPSEHLNGYAAGLETFASSLRRTLNPTAEERRGLSGAALRPSASSSRRSAAFLFLKRRIARAKP